METVAVMTGDLDFFAKIVTPNTAPEVPKQLIPC